MAHVNSTYDLALDEIDISSGVKPSRRHVADVRGSTVSFHDLNYSVDIPTKCCRTNQKQILFDVR